jgi:hypothetical protein
MKLFKSNKADVADGMQSRDFVYVRLRRHCLRTFLTAVNIETPLPKWHLHIGIEAKRAALHRFSQRGDEQ